MLNNGNVVIFILLLGVALSWFLFQSSEEEMSLLNEEYPSITPVSLNRHVKIAIIGSGIGGSSASFFLRKHLGPKAEIHVYEKSSKIGGRLDIEEFDGNSFEAGGSIIHSSNRYMVRFINELGLEKNFGGGNGKLGIYNGKHFVFVESENGYLTKLKMIWRYGFFSLWNMSKSLGNMLKTFVNIYKIQDGVKSFKTVPEMLKAIGGDYFFNYTQKTAAEIMYDNGVGKLLIEELVSSVTRSNYGQDARVNGFTGYVSMAGAQGGSLFSVKGGNYQVPKKLLQKSNATVFLNNPIHSIHKVKHNGNNIYLLNKKKNDDMKMGDEIMLDTIDMHAYDAIIVAAPLEVPTTNLRCVDCTNWPTRTIMGKYQQTIATFVQSELNSGYFNIDKKENLPTAILTTENPSDKFSSIGRQSNVDGDDVNPPIYKVFSRTVLKDDILNDLFVMNSTMKIISWLAYPHYTPPEQFYPFLLDDGVFYVNSIERAASAMEMSSIGGRNAALLARDLFINSNRANV